MLEAKNHNLFKKIIPGDLTHASVIMMLGSLAGGVLGYVFHILLGRAFQPEEYALFSALLAVIAIFGSIRGGIGMLLVKKITELNIKERDVELSAIYTSLCTQFFMMFSLVLIALYVLSSYIQTYLRVPSASYIFCLGILIFISFVASINTAVLQALQRFWALSIIGMLNHILRIIFIVGVAFAGFGVLGALWGAVLASLFLLLGAYLLFKDVIGFKIRYLTRFSEFKWSGAIPVFMANIGFVVLTQLDMILVQHYYNSLDAGLYAAASTLGKALLYLVGAIVIALFPMVAESHAKNENPFHLLRQALIMGAIFCGIGSLIYFFEGQLIIQLLYGNAYSSGGEILQYYGLAILPMALVLLMENFLIARGKVFFGYLVFLMAPIQILLIHFFHGNILNVVYVLALSGFVLLVVGFICMRTKYLN
ncbi:oligosaccharide flippase family protein [Polynucleobacter wuianus]|uniref:oligosaccharide flippase family protein n=1 Tax=Polynucleobacter wuianus TaxID=1743168 RepID=UPI001C0BE9C8|nr:oligosaccharide flippase family protein [Polynucleobacter wuianus]MBU3610978.1 oligosaccharide flippase family protein [Polynucleobacter wuianus]